MYYEGKPLKITETNDIVFARIYCCSDKFTSFKTNDVAICKIKTLISDKKNRLWSMVRLVLIGYKDKECLFGKLPMDMIKEICGCILCD